MKYESPHVQLRFDGIQVLLHEVVRGLDEEVGHEVLNRETDTVAGLRRSYVNRGWRIGIFI